MKVKADRSQITVIPASKSALGENGRSGPEDKLRVAAYCRVSSEKDEQLNSFEVQVQYYTEKIASNPKWKLVDIYADEGITGTSMKKREDFKRMLRACREGRIDLILVKSVSRFGRNTVDIMKTVRSLQEKGIGVQFEKEGIDTRRMNSEMMLAFHSAFSQSESESLRENVSMGFRMGYKQGKVTVPSSMLGFKKGEDGEVLIDEEQAETIRLIYDLYLGGASLELIKAELERQGRKTARGSGEWNRSVIQNILQNEKYKGDALLQKTYRPSLFSQRVENDGVLPKYYITGCLPAIVPPEKFALVQEEMKRRNTRRPATEKAKNPFEGKHSGKYALSTLLICGNCGARYRRKIWARNGTKKIVWRCINRLENGKAFCPDSLTLEEEALQRTIMEAVREQYLDTEDITRVTMNSFAKMLTPSGADEEYTIRNRLQMLKEKKAELIKRCLDEGDSDRYDLMFTNIMNEITALNARLDEIEAASQNMSVDDARLQEIGNLLAKFAKTSMEFDNAIVYQIVRVIKVFPDGTLEITFQDGHRTTTTVK